MRFKISTSLAMVFAMIMVFGFLVASSDDGGKALMQKMYQKGKTAELKECDDKEISTLMTEYMSARQNVDMKKLEECVDDPSEYKQSDLENLKKMIKEVDGIKCYTMEGWEDGSYVVFVRYNTKVNNVSSKLPNLVRDFVVKDDSGKFRVKTKIKTKNEPKAVRYVLGTEENEEVKNLIQQVDDDIEKVKKEDAAAKVYFESLAKLSKQKQDEKKKEDNPDANKEENKDDKKEDAAKDQGQAEQKQENNDEKKDENADQQKKEEEAKQEQNNNENTEAPKQEENNQNNQQENT